MRCPHCEGRIVFTDNSNSRCAGGHVFPKTAAVKRNLAGIDKRWRFWRKKLDLRATISLVTLQEELWRQDSSKARAFAAHILTVIREFDNAGMFSWLWFDYQNTVTNKYPEARWSNKKLSLIGGKVYMIGSQDDCWRTAALAIRRKEL